MILYVYNDTLLSLGAA